MDIQKSEYTATPADIGILARSYFSAQEAQTEGRLTYLRALVATAQVHVRLNSSEAVTAIEQVHEQFYVEVLKAAQEVTPPKVPGRALIVNRKTNFARTSYSTLRSWVKAGGDLMKLVPKRVTKAAVTAVRAPKPLSSVRLRKRIEGRAAALMEAAIAMESADRDGARLALIEAIEALQERVDAIKSVRPARRRPAHDGDGARSPPS